MISFLSLPNEIKIDIFSKIIHENNQPLTCKEKSYNFLSLRCISKELSDLLVRCLKDQFRSVISNILSDILILNSVINSISKDGNEDEDENEDLFHYGGDNVSIIKISHDQLDNLKKDLNKINMNVTSPSKQNEDYYKLLIKIVDLLIDVISTLPANVKCRLLSIIKETSFNGNDIILITKQALELHRGDVFMYPNGIYFIDKEESVLNLDKYIGLNIPDDEIVDNQIASIDCWMTNRENQNWPRHGHITCIPEYVPIHLFIGKKEGDSISYNYDGHKIKLTLAQIKYRYKDAGEFDRSMVWLINSNICYQKQYIEQCGHQDNVCEKCNGYNKKIDLLKKYLNSYGPNNFNPDHKPGCVIS